MKLQLGRLLHSKFLHRKGTNLLLILGTEDNINLKRVDMKFYVPILERFFGCNIQT